MALAIGVIVLLAGCSGYETDPGVADQPGSSSLRKLAEKIDLVQHDPCFREPNEYGDQSCARYLEQLASIASNATNSAPNTPVEQAGAKLAERIRDVRSRGCPSTPSEMTQPCASALAAVSEALITLENSLASAPPTQPTTRTTTGS